MTNSGRIVDILSFYSPPTFGPDSHTGWAEVLEGLEPHIVAALRVQLRRRGHFDSPVIWGFDHENRPTVFNGCHRLAAAWAEGHDEIDLRYGYGDPDPTQPCWEISFQTDPGPGPGDDPFDMVSEHLRSFPSPDDDTWIEFDAVVGRGPVMSLWLSASNPVPHAQALAHHCDRLGWGFQLVAVTEIPTDDEPAEGGGGRQVLDSVGDSS